MACISRGVSLEGILALGNNEVMILLNQFVRYVEIANIIAGGEYNKLLEVGSGTRGIGEYTSKPFVGCDLVFMDHSQRLQTIHPRMKPVAADGLALPFKGRSFELVISSDVLEHIQPALRAEAVRELCRVASRLVILSFPCGERAFDCDYRLRKFYRKLRKATPEWLNDHLKRGFPDEKEIASHLCGLGLDFRIKGNENLWLHYLIMVLESYGSLKFKLAAVAELMNHDGDVPQHLSSKARIAQWILRSLSPLKSIINIGPTYRKTFIIHL